MLARLVRGTHASAIGFAARAQSTAAASTPAWSTYSVTATGETIRATVTARQHSVHYDEPTRLGGTDKAITPLEGQLAALAGCKSITLWSIAKGLGFKPKSITIPKLEGTLDLRGLRGVEGVPSRFQKVVMEIDFDAEGGDLETLKELKSRVGKRCPVADLMHAAGVDMQVTLRCRDMSV